MLLTLEMYTVLMDSADMQGMTEERTVTEAASGCDRSPPYLALSAEELSPGLRLILGCRCRPSVLERIRREEGGR